MEPLWPLGEASVARECWPAEALKTPVLLKAFGGAILGAVAPRTKLRPPRHDLRKYVSLPDCGLAKRADNLIPTREL